MPRPTGIYVGYPNHHLLHDGDAVAINSLFYDPTDTAFAGGANGNGSADCGPAFNACTSACIADGVLMKPKKPSVAYQFATPWSIPASNGFRCDLGGRYTHTYRAASGLNDHLVKFVSAAGDHVEAARFWGGTVDHRNTLQTAGSAFHCKGAVHCVFDDVHVANPYDVGFLFEQMGNSGFGHHNKVLWGLIDGGSGSAGNGGGVRWNGSDENWLVGTDMENMCGLGAKNQAIRDEVGLNQIWYPNFVSISNNGTAIRCQDCNDTTIVGAEGDGVAGHYIVVVGGRFIVADCKGQILGENGSISGGADGILLDFNSQLCTVQRNVLRSASTNNKTRSLIRESGLGTVPKNSFQGNTLEIVGTIQGNPLHLPDASLSKVLGNYGAGLTPMTASASYTLLGAEAARGLHLTGSSAQNVTVPPSSSVNWEIGTLIPVRRMGTGGVTFVAGSGVTIRSRSGLASVNGQYGRALLEKVATDEWLLSGDLV